MNFCYDFRFTTETCLLCCSVVKPLGFSCAWESVSPWGCAGGLPLCTRSFSLNSLLPLMLSSSPVLLRRAKLRASCFIHSICMLRFAIATCFPSFEMLMSRHNTNEESEGDTARWDGEVGFTSLSFIGRVMPVLVHDRPGRAVCHAAELPPGDTPPVTPLRAGHARNNNDPNSFFTDHFNHENSHWTINWPHNTTYGKGRNHKYKINGLSLRWLTSLHEL